MPFCSFLLREKMSSSSDCVPIVPRAEKRKCYKAGWSCSVTRCSTSWRWRGKWPTGTKPSLGRNLECFKLPKVYDTSQDTKILLPALVSGSPRKLAILLVVSDGPTIPPTGCSIRNSLCVARNDIHFSIFISLRHRQRAGLGLLCEEPSDGDAEVCRWGQMADSIKGQETCYSTPILLLQSETLDRCLQLLIAFRTVTVA